MKTENDNIRRDLYDGLHRNSPKCFCLAGSHRRACFAFLLLFQKIKKSRTRSHSTCHGKFLMPRPISSKPLLPDGPKNAIALLFTAQPLNYRLNNHHNSNTKAAKWYIRRNGVVKPTSFLQILIKFWTIRQKLDPPHYLHDVDPVVNKFFLSLVFIIRLYLFYNPEKNWIESLFRSFVFENVFTSMKIQRMYHPAYQHSPFFSI